MPHCEGQVRVETQLVTEPLQGGNGLTQKGKPLGKKTLPVLVQEQNRSMFTYSTLLGVYGCIIIGLERVFPFL